MKVRLKKTAIIVGLASIIWPIVISYRQAEAITLYVHNIFDMRLPFLIVVALIAGVASFILGAWLLIKIVSNKPHSAMSILIILLVAILLLIVPWADWAIGLPLEKMNQVVS